jgi:hypothetical protein
MTPITHLQLSLAIGSPILSVLTSLTVSLVQIGSIRGDVESLRADMRDLRRDFGELRKEAREDRLQIAADIKLLTSKIYELMGQK